MTLTKKGNSIIDAITCTHLDVNAQRGDKEYGLEKVCEVRCLDATYKIVEWLQEMTTAIKSSDYKSSDIDIKGYCIGVCTAMAKSELLKMIIRKTDPRFSENMSAEK